MKKERDGTRRKKKITEIASNETTKIKRKTTCDAQH